MDLTKLSPAATQDAIQIGQKVGSEHTLAQATATIAASALWEDAMRAAGWRAQDHDDLVWLHKALSAEEAARSEVSEANRDHILAMRAARKQHKSTRRDAVEDLRMAIRDTHRSATPDQLDTIERLSESLARQTDSGQSLLKLAAQLDALAAIASDPWISAALASRGKDQLAASLTQSAADARALFDQTNQRTSTTAHTERLDLLDGLIIQLVRDARRLARRAARDGAQPELARAFELTHI
jgi:hypothetical protein